MRVAVIGAGVIGTTTAWYLARLGHEVTVVDRAPGVGEETSFANGGMLHASHTEPWNAPGVAWELLRMLGREDSPLLLRPGQIPALAGWGLGFLRNSARRRFERNTRANARLATYSLSALQALRRETGIHYDDRQNGIVKLFHDQASLDKALHASHLMEEAGVRYSVLDARQTVALEPAFTECQDQITGAIYYPDDESGDALQFTRRLAERAAAEGVTFRLNTTVRALERSGDRIEALRTDAGPVEAEQYVLAAGSTAPLLTRPIGLRLPIYPVKGYSVTLPVDGWPQPPEIPVIDDARKVVLAVLGDRIRMAGTAEFAGYDHTISERRARSVLKQVLTLFPSLEPLATQPRLTFWSGLRPMTMDGPPILGPTPLRNLHLNTGSGHLGWTFACGAGRLVADLVAGREPEIDPRGLGLDRYGR